MNSIVSRCLVSAVRSSTAQKFTPSLRCFSADSATQEEDTDEKAFEHFHQLPLAYSKFPLESVDFRVTTSMNGRVIPEIHTTADVEHDRRGLVHLVPWSRVMTGYIGERGNSIRRTDREPHEGHQEVGLDTSPLNEGTEYNQELINYFSWLKGLKEKLVDHLSENWTSYDALQSLEEYKDDPEVLKEKLSEMTARSVVPKRNEVGEDIPGAEYSFFRSKLFFRPRATSNVNRTFFATPFDKSVYEEQGLLRVNVPVYDDESNLIPIEERRLFRGDVVGIQTRLGVFLRESLTGVPRIGFNRNLMSVVIRRRNETEAFNRPQESPRSSNPFGENDPFKSE